MLKAIKRSWEKFKEGTPGKRFQEQYQRRHQSGGSNFKNILFIVGGVALVAAGLFFLPAPGPGTVILLAGAGLIAQASLTTARFMDWLELRVRRLLAWLRKAWRKSSPPVKVVWIVAAVALTGGVAFGAYRLFTGG